MEGKVEFILTNSAESDRIESRAAPELTTSETSREKTLYWDPIAIPPGLNGPWQFSTRVSNLTVTIVEQTSPRVSTRFIASGTYFNQTQDDRNHTSSIWTISLRNAGRVELERFQFSLTRGHCSYNGEEPFRFEFATPNNNIDIIERGWAHGLKPGGYEGGC